MDEPENGPAVSKLIELSQYRVRGYRRKGFDVKSYLRNTESAMNANQPLLMKTQSSEQDPYEYKSIPYRSGKLGNLAMKRWTDEGWEPVTATSANVTQGWVFKERKPGNMVLRRRKDRAKPVGDITDIGMRGGRTGEEVKANQKARQEAYGLHGWAKFMDAATGGRSTAKKMRKANG